MGGNNMILKMLEFLFSKFIGRLPESKREKFWAEFKDLMVRASSAAAEGRCEHSRAHR